MKQEEFTNLLNNYLDGTATEAEQQALNAYYDALQKDMPDWEANKMGNQDAVHDRILAKIYQRIDLVPASPKYKKMTWLAIAASVLMTLGIAGYGFFKYNKNHQIPDKQVVSTLKPGGNKAILTLSDGRKINLAQVKNGKIAEQAGLSITKTASGELLYEINADVHVGESLSYNTIYTPRGGQYQVRLPDGTKVWLNAASALRYPTQFKAGERTVELTGEGYFEVTKDSSRPFKVITATQEVEVLGTHFNINAYSDEPSVKTTLLEGSVRLFAIKKNGLNSVAARDKVILKPGEQATLNDSGIRIEAVDAKSNIDWINGEFIFNNEDIRSAMRKLARWYDVEVIYEGNFSDISFGGSFSRLATLNESVKILESTNKLKCRIEGRRVYIKR